jgi:hypothetical protein
MVPSRQLEKERMMETASKTFVKQLVEKKMGGGFLDLDKKAMLTSRGGFFPEIDEKYRRQREDKLRPLRTSRKKETSSTTNLKPMMGERASSVSQFEKHMKVEPTESPTRRFKRT